MKPRNDYHVRITVNGKSVRVAYYTTTDEAQFARLRPKPSNRTSRQTGRV